LRILLEPRWPHLGHMLANGLSDHDDIVRHRNAFIGQINNLLCQFSALDPFMVNNFTSDSPLVRTVAHYGVLTARTSSVFLVEMCIFVPNVTVLIAKL
jgi:hypothetical protein